MDVLSFDGEYRFLSNFWPCTVTYLGMRFPTVEHAYQAAKCKRPEDYARFQACIRPSEAKALGKLVDMRRDWDDAKLGVMLDLLQQKFGDDPLLCKLLIATHPFVLIEGNTWGDTYWGVCRGKGKNHLGRLLMQVRDELIAKQRGAQ